MDLNAVASSQTRAVTPATSASYQASVGPPMTNPDGSQTPGYASPVTVLVDIQALSYRDLVQISGLNLNGERRSVYMEGEAYAVVRSLLKGGDLLTVSSGPDAGVWLIVQLMENWPNWCRFVVTLQNGS